MTLGIHVGDYVAIDPVPEYLPESGFLNSRHLDDKAGVAVVLGAAKAVLDSGRRLPIDCHLIFTISEEVGSGSSHTLHGDVAVPFVAWTVLSLRGPLDRGAHVQWPGGFA